jgi:hypothetical protein
VDGDLRKLLQDLSASMKQIAARDTPARIEQSTSSETGQIKTDVALTRSDLAWHRNIGWGIAGAYAVIFSWLLLHYFPHEMEHAREQSKADFASQLQPIGEKLAVLTATIETTRPDASKRLPKLLKQSLDSHGPDLRLGVQLVRAVVDKAREVDVKIDRSEIRQAGERLTSIAASNSNIATLAWESFLALANYQSWNNADSVPSTPNATPADQITLTAVAGAGVPFGLSVFRYGTVPFAKSAKYEPIGKEMNAGKSLGSEFIVVEHRPPTMNLRLDGMHLRNVIFRDATIEYLGGRVILENVYFVNCRFEIVQKPGGEKLGSALLASASIFKLAHCRCFATISRHEERSSMVSCGLRGRAVAYFCVDARRGAAQYVEESSGRRVVSRRRSVEAGALQ